MNQIMIVLEIITFVAFIIAAIYAILKHQKIKEITNIWLSMGIALFFLALASLIHLSEIIPDLEALNGLQTLVLVIAATIMCSDLSHYRKERMLAKDGRDGKLKEKDGKKYEKIEAWLRGI